MTNATYMRIGPSTPEEVKDMWATIARIYSDPGQVSFRKAWHAPEMAGELEKLLTVHPELRDFKGPETEGALVVTLRVAFEPGKMHNDNVDEFFARLFVYNMGRLTIKDWQIEEAVVAEILPAPYYRPGDVFDNPISVQEIPSN